MADEAGTAAIEFGLFFLVVVIPLVYVIFMAADIQRAMLATSSAAREAARVYVTADTVAQARAAADTAVSDDLGDYGLGGVGRASMRIQCVPLQSACGSTLADERGDQIVVTVTYDTPLVRIPFVGLVAGPDLPVTAVERVRVDRFRGF